MVATKRLARLLSVSIVAMGILVAVAAPSVSAHSGQTVSKSLIPAVGSCEFFKRDDDFFSSYISNNGTRYHLSWEVIMYSEFNWATHGFCGRAMEKVCMTTPYPYPQDPGKIYNESYYSSNDLDFYFIQTTSGAWSWHPNMTECVSNGPFGILYYDYMSVVSWIYDVAVNANSFPINQTYSSRPVGEW